MSGSDCVIIEDSPIRKSISCENIPEIFLDKLVAKRHFTQFGRVKRFILRPKRLSCTVEYETTEYAENALAEGGIYKDQRFDIFWTPVEKNSPKAIDDNLMDPDVQAELDAMGAPSTRKTLNTNKQVLSSLESFLKKTERLPAPLSGAPVKTTRINVPKIKQPLETDGKTSQARQEFENLARNSAITSEEKYQVLDAKDKYLRLTTTKTTDIREAKSTEGTCPDMCPERERYMREAKNQIASFEYASENSQQMNHFVAIKQYSRSSADQESPLPHELRSEKVLHMTMMYLLHRIVDLCDDERTNISDWFHYLWDRTRSIRKDITQQELCSRGSVLLVEQCARFHIHCSARLVAEEPSVFDHKINTENLTKCLQSLKYMYTDLSLKGIDCPNEAEFRAYVVLLNLNDGNFLWEIKQLSPNILNSQEIRFALDVYFALENNNYIKFFQLLQKTTYMNACILFRYFNQVRLKAVNVIMKAYTARTPTNFTISYLTSILAFEDVEMACSFLEYYGLPCDRENDYVYLDRKMFYYPDIPYTLDRAYIMVESKRLKSVGETICGGKLDSPDIFEKHRIYNSFDSNGLLKNEVWREMSKVKEDPKDEPDSHIFKVPSPSNISPKFTTPKSSPQPSNIFLSRLGNKPEPPSIFGKSQPPTLSGITPIFGNNVTNVFNQAPKSIFNSTANTIFGGITSKPEELANATNIFGSFNQQNAFFQTPKPNLDDEEKENLKKEEEKRRTEELEGARQLELERIEQERARIEREKEAELKKLKLLEEAKQKKLEERKRIEMSSKKLLESLVEEFVDENVRNIAEALLDHRKMLKELPPKIYEEISGEVVDEILTEIINQELEILRSKQLRNFNIIRKYFNIWRENVSRVVDNRNKIENTPSWLPSRSIEEQVLDCYRPHQNDTLMNIRRYLSGSPDVIKIPKEDAKKIDVFEVVKHKLLNQSNRISSKGILKSHVYWKLTISIPLKQEEDSSGFYYYIDKWLSNTFRRETEANKDVFFLEQRSPKNFRERLIICMRKLRGFNVVDENNKSNSAAVDNSNGVLFLMSSINVEMSRKRLHNLLANASIWGPVPLTIIVYNSHIVQREIIESKLQLDALLEEQKISDFNILMHDESGKVNQKSLKVIVEQSLVFLAQNYAIETSLEMQSQVAFISSCLGDELWQRLRLSSEQNYGLFQSTGNFNFVINIYNQAIQRVVNLVQHDFSVYPDFPDEFRPFVSKKVFDIPLDYEYFPKDWKSKQKQTQLADFFKALTLKTMRNVTFSDLSDVQTKLRDFVKEHLEDSKKSQKIGYSMYREVLDQFRQMDEFNLSTKLEFTDKMLNVNWINVVSIFTNEALQTRWSQKYSELPNEVIYQKNEFESYSKRLWWLKEVKFEAPVLAVEEDDEELMPPEPKKAKLSLKFSKQDLDAILQKGMTCLQKADEKLNKCKEMTSQTQELSKDLDVNLFEQERIFRICRRVWDENFKC